VFAGKEHANFCVLGFLLDLFDFANKVRHYVFPLVRQFDKRFQVFDVSCQFGIQLDVLFQAASRLEDCLRLFLIIPEFGLRYFFFELENLRVFVFRIKDTLELAVSFPRLRPLSLEVLRAFSPSSY
jgi:hypothetical protein